MKRLIYQVYVGKRSKLYDHCTYSVAEYAKRIGAEYIQQRAPKLMIKPDPFFTNRSRESYEKYGGYLPIFEKENAFGYLDQYDQIAIIDADIYIRPEVQESIFDDVGTDCDFAGVIERSMPLTDMYKAKIQNYSRMQFSNIKTVDWKWNNLGAEFYNMGMMVVNNSLSKYLRGDTPKQFIERPRFKGFVDGMGNWKWSTDQVLLNTWVKEENMKVNNLHWKWNGLFSVNTDIKQCNFVHFFLKDKLPHRGEDVDMLMSMI